MTYRDRREARAERLTEWAGKREDRAAAVFAAGEPMRSDWAFITQPGHIPERARMIARDDRAHESLVKAERMREKAANIQAAADRAIYSDDPDAIERLREKLTDLEAQRARIKAYNATCRKGARDLSVLSDAQVKNLTDCARAGQVDNSFRMPAYVLSNLGGVITTTKKRLAQLEAKQG